MNHFYERRWEKKERKNTNKNLNTYQVWKFIESQILKFHKNLFFWSFFPYYFWNQETQKKNNFKRKKQIPLFFSIFDDFKPLHYSIIVTKRTMNISNVFHVDSMLSIFLWNEEFKIKNMIFDFLIFLSYFKYSLKLAVWEENEKENSKKGIKKKDLVENVVGLYH